MRCQTCQPMPGQFSVPNEIALSSRTFRTKDRKKYIRVYAGPPYMVPFTPVENRDGYTLRLLQPHPIARTAYSSRGDGYLTLGSYMSGANQTETRYPESHPIVMSYTTEDKDGKDWKKMMQVYLHQEDNTQAPALPNDKSIIIDIAGGEIIAAKKFEGNATQEVCEQNYRALVGQLEVDFGPNALPAQGTIDFQLAQYGPLHSLSPRLNEIWIKIKM